MKNVTLRFAVVAALAVRLFASSPEYPVGATEPSPAPGHRRDPAVATDGTDFFVVWVDDRTPGFGAIVGTRVNRNGQVLDPYGIRIASVGASRSLPAAVWDGCAWVIAWTQGTRYGESRHRSELWIARLDRDGRILAAPRLVRENTITTPGVYAASNGSVTVVAYRDDSYSSSAVRTVVLDRDGNITHSEPLEAPSADLALKISIAATSTRFVVTWSTNDSKVFAASLGNDGRLLGPRTDLGTGDYPSIATDGTFFTIAWSRSRLDPLQSALMSRTVNAELTEIGPEQTILSQPLVGLVSLLWRDDRYEFITASYADLRSTLEIRSIELHRDGHRRVLRRRGLDPLYPWDDPQPVAVTNGSDLFFAYAIADVFVDQFVARLYRGSASEPFAQELLSRSGNAHTVPQIASSRSGHLAAWIENVNVYATRIHPNGNSLDGRGEKLSDYAYSVRVAFDGTNYVVAWEGSLTIGVRYISPATGATVAQLHVPATMRNGFSLAVSPEAAYLAWVAYGDDRVVVTRVTPASQTAEVPLVVSPEGMVAENAAIAWNGSTLLVAWKEMESPPGTISFAPRIRAARVARRLSLLDPAPMTVATAGAPEAYALGAPSIASNGEDWLVVSDVDERQIVARRVLSSGNVEGAEASKIGDGGTPAVTWDGTRYAIAYRSRQDRFSREPQSPLLLGEVPAKGALPVMRPRLVATHVVSPPSVARTRDDDVAVIYTKVSFLPEHTGVERGYFRVMDFVELGIGRGRGVRR